MTSELSPVSAGTYSPWYKDKHKFGLGDVCRYRVRYVRRDNKLPHIYLRVKNVEKTGLRAFHLLNGPFELYCHVVPCRYSPLQRFSPEDPSGNGEVCFRNSIKPGQTFNVQLALNNNSVVETLAGGATVHEWTCDVICQVVLNRRGSLRFVVMIGDNLVEMRRISRSPLTALSKGDFSKPQKDPFGEVHRWGVSLDENLSVERQTTAEIWNKAPRDPNRPVHLVIATHGIFSNLTADMLYLRDAIMSLDSDNYLVEGFRGNAGRTEKGIHRLGVGVAAYVTALIDELLAKGMEIGGISFVGHSLGGPVQLYALKHILLVHGTDYFEKQRIRLRHFVCLASPMLGILSEMSLWISWFLDLGTLGKTGRDLTLSKKLPNLKQHGDAKMGLVRPLLETLPDEPIQSALKKFESRTVYANAVNDGIVPLRTSALLYLDWEALGDVKDLQRHPNSATEKATEDSNTDSSLDGSPNGTLGGTQNDVDDNATHHEVLVSASRGTEGVKHPRDEVTGDNNNVGQVPEDPASNVADKYSNFLARIFNIDEQALKGERRRKRIKKRVKKYAKISAKGKDRLDTQDTKAEEEAFESTEDEVSTLNIPPKASAVESAINSLICPIPSREYIDNPSTRKPVIFHDKFYHFNAIPEASPHIGSIAKFFRYHDWRMEKQVKMARKYHAPGISWRKVLVYLPPDAHNNIVVRRRFANGYGWGVIEHLKSEIFGDNKLVAKF